MKRGAPLFTRSLTVVPRRTETLATQATRPTVPQRTVSVDYIMDLSIDYPVYGPTLNTVHEMIRKKNLGVVKIAICASFLSLLLVNV